jgi:uncharacterized membrane protein
MAIAIALHLLAAVVWVGGMFFAYMALRPVAGSLLERPVRLTLWSQVFGHFFPWVWVSIGVLLATGLWMIFAVLGGMANVGVHVHAMLLVGAVMMLIFAHLYLAPFARLKRAVANQTWSEGGAQLNKIRTTIAINLTLGLLVVIIGSAGRYL